MSAMDFEYAIKKDVRNNPIVREVDEARQRQLLALGRRSADSWSWCILFSAWQHFELLRPRLRDRSGCSSERAERGRDQPPPAARDRDAACAGAASSGIATEAAAPGRARARPGDRPRAGDAVGASRKIHRRGALTPVRARQEDRWRTNTAADSGSPGAGRRSAIAAARAASASPTGATRCDRACWSARRCWRCWTVGDRGAARLPAGHRSTPT